jgi:hypothetical protein
LFRFGRVFRFSGNPCVCILIVLLALSLGACSKGGGGNDAAFGGLTFSLIAPSGDTAPVQYKSVDFPCEEYQISSVEAEVLDSLDAVVATGGPWSCSGGKGTIGSLKAGDNYTLWVYLRNSEGQVRYQGSVGGLRVRMGRITNAEVELHRINLTPVFEEIDSQETRAGQGLVFAVNASDPDGDPLTYTALSLPPGASFDPDSASFSWTPTNSQVGNFLARFQVSDNMELEEGEILEVSIIVTGPNRPPVFDSVKTRYVQEGQSLKFSIRATDPDGDTVTFSALSLPSGATFNPDTGAFSWRPGYAQGGSYTVRFEATDSSNPPQNTFLDVSIVVTDTNRSPVLQVPTDIQRVSIGGNLEFRISATDPDGNGLTYSAANLPRNSSGVYFPGVSFDEATGTFRWVSPGAAAVDEYQVLFFVIDAGKPPRSDYEYVTIQVYDGDYPIDGCPVLSEIGPKHINLGEILEFTLSAHDPDPEFDLVYAAEPIPAKPFPQGSTFDHDTGLFSWQPDTAGNYWILFSVTDLLDNPLKSDSEEVMITVGDVNRPPVLDPIGDRVVWDGETLKFTIFATDPDGDSLSYSAGNLPPGAVFDAYTHTFSWTPHIYTKSITTKCIPQLTYTVRFSVTDNGIPQESDYEDMEITVLFE